MKVEKSGFPFTFETTACDSCSGRCCTGESGAIWVTMPEMQAMAKHHGWKLVNFMRKYTRKVGRRYSLVEKPWAEDEHACIFFAGQCMIYDVRPEQCRTFPFWSRYRNKRRLDELMDECPGVTP